MQNLVPRFLRTTMLCLLILAPELAAQMQLSIETYTTAGAHNYTTPANTEWIVVKAWGSGGLSTSGGDEENSWYSSGGSGGFVSATYLIGSGQGIAVHVPQAAAGAATVSRNGGFQLSAAGGGDAWSENDSGNDGLPASVGANEFDPANGYVAGSGVASENNVTNDPNYPGNRVGEGATEGDTPQDAGTGAVVIIAFRSTPPPVASFTTTPSFGRVSQNVSFNGSGSSVAEGTITGYEWDFENNGSTDATGVTASHLYTNNGSSVLNYVAKLKVTASSGLTNSTTRTITIYPSGSYTLSVQNGTGSSSSGSYYLPGSAASIAGNALLPTQQFAGWTLVSGSGTFGNSSALNTTFSGTADSVVRANYGPTAPGNLASASHTVSAINLTWTASADDVGVTGYDVYRTRGGTTNLLATLSGSTLAFVDTQVLPNGSYSYHIKAKDGAGNVSAASNTISVTADVTDSDGDGIPNTLETLFNNSNPTADTGVGLKTHRPAP